jgi:lysophospholipase L1-like esterase
MKKIHTLVFSGLMSGFLFAQDLPPITTMPVVHPPLPPGANTAVYPEVRLDWWFEKVRENIALTSQSAATCQLLFDGDSITAGWLINGKHVWEKAYAQYNPVDFGINGDCTQNVLWRLAQGQSTGMNPKLVVVLIGTNNINSNTAEQIADGVKAVVAAYEKACPNSVILVQGIFPRGEKPDDPSRAKIKQINGIISALDNGKTVLYLDFGDKFLQPDGTITRDIMPDFLHPSEKGYQIWVDAIQPIVSRYLPAK